MEIGTVKQIDINAEMQDSYLDYAMSVIVARALPDVRDGLKPVHRRILYAMHDMGIDPDKPYRKSARIVGEVLGKYHPHGDAAVYESMVRMAQSFSMRYPLVDGQGNFGSIDGDEAAAMRYTEARLSTIATEMLKDLDKETVAFGPNFDATLDEPLVLPGALPNFLVNGASGIAVGMATNVPPHNLGEVCDALCYMIDRYLTIDDIPVEDLMAFVKGPDFPTGGIVYRYSEEGKVDNDGQVSQTDQILAAYAVGRGRFIVQARAHFEEMTRNRSRIVVTELPYQVNKTRLIERIAELVRDSKLEGVSDLRDESDRQGMRLVIELTRTVDPRDVLARLFKLTPMRMTFGVNMLALVDGEPRTLSLKRCLWHYLEHRRQIVTRRTQFDLEKARRQAHILEGLLIALDNLDAVIATIRRSRNADTARTNLIRDFKLTEIQAQAILDMMLRRLAALEQQKIREEYKDKLALIAFLEDLLGDENKILGVIRQGLLELKQRYGDARRTQLVDRAGEVMMSRDLVAEEEIILAASGDKLWREPVSGRRRGTAIGQGQLGLTAAAYGKTTEQAALFTQDGRGVLLPIHQLPAGTDAALSLGELLNTRVTATVIAVLSLPAEHRQTDPPTGFLILVSIRGKIKRISLADFCASAGRGLTTVMGLDASEDRLVGAFFSSGEEEVLLVSSSGMAIRFGQEDVRPMGLPAAGVAGMRLAEGDIVAGAGLVRPKSEVVVLTVGGYAKRTPVESYPSQKRYGGGVLGARLPSRAGQVVGAALAQGKDELFTVQDNGKVSGSTPGQIAPLGRPAQVKPFLKLAAGRKVTRLLAVGHPAGDSGDPASAEVDSTAVGQEEPKNLAQQNQTPEESRTRVKSKETASIQSRRTPTAKTGAKRGASRRKELKAEISSPDEAALTAGSGKRAKETPLQKASAGDKAPSSRGKAAGVAKSTAPKAQKAVTKQPHSVAAAGDQGKSEPAPARKKKPLSSSKTSRPAKKTENIEGTEPTKGSSQGEKTAAETTQKTIGKTRDESGAGKRSGSGGASSPRRRRIVTSVPGGGKPPDAGS